MHNNEHTPMHTKTKWNKSNEQYSLVSNIAPNVKQIYPRINNITGLVTCNRLCIFETEKLGSTALERLQKHSTMQWSIRAQLFSTSEPGMEVLIMRLSLLHITYVWWSYSDIYLALIATKLYCFNVCIPLHSVEKPKLSIYL